MNRSSVYHNRVTRPRGPVLVGLNRALPGAVHASFGARGLAACMGRGGLHGLKREGDGRSPRGRFFLEYGLFRPDRIPRPCTRLPLYAITPEMGWCDDPGHAAYNRPVRLPLAASHERLWRQDGLYDLVLVISHNRHPAIKGRGSAIFLHCMETGRGPTAGCIAFERERLVALVRLLRAGDAVVLGRL